MRTSPLLESGTGLKAGTAVHHKGRRKVREILAAARGLLIDEDYTQFSLRNIARRAGIHLSNLQYYFPTREDLIHGLMAYVAAGYDEKYAELFSGLPDDPETRFAAVIDYLIEDISDPVTRRFFIQLWALLESSGTRSGGLLNELYALHIGNIYKLMEPISPRLAAGERQQRATMIAAMIEGMMLMIGGADKRHKRGKTSVQEMMRRELLRIAHGD